ncbi:unnamed protein product, partial [Amoebophrya sp. A120]
GRRHARSVAPGSVRAGAKTRTPRGLTQVAKAGSTNVLSRKSVGARGAPEAASSVPGRGPIPVRTKPVWGHPGEERDRP